MNSKRTLAICLLLFVSAILASCGDDKVFVRNNSLPPHRPIKSRFIHQRGRQLMSPDGKPLVLKAVNLGGWLHWEAWMFGCELDFKRLDLGSEGQLLARFEKYYGKEAAARFQRLIHRHWITEADLSAIAARGFDAVRLPLNHTLLEQEAGWRFLREVVDKIKRANLKVILDMHAAPGGQSHLFPADPEKVLLWDDKKKQDRLVELWRRLAKEYRDEPAVAAYDLLNEPDCTKEQLISMYKRIIPAIRSHDREHLILIEGLKHSRDFNCFDERLDDNMTYSPHVYLWIGKPDAAWLRQLTQLAKFHDTPVWVGEFGEDLLPDLKGLRIGFETLSGWAIWSWKRVRNGGLTGSVNNFAAPPAWMRLIKSLHPANPARPVMSEKAAFAALNAFLSASARYHPFPGMKDALGL